MRLSSTRSSTRRLAATVLAAGFAAGCVTKGAHDEVVAERDRLAQRARDLARSNEALDEERVALLEEMEDLREARANLSREIAALERTREELADNLRQRDAQVQELSKLSGNYEELVKDLESEVAAGQIQITQLREGLRLNLSQDILFRSGAVKLEPYGVRVLQKVASQLARFPQRVEVRGHSDDVPLSAALSARWGSNWELAAARASQVVRLLESEGVDPARLVAVSFGQHAPVASNDTADGRALNRRIEIRLIPLDASDAVPAAAAEATSDTTP